MNPIEVNEEFDPIDKLIQEFPAVFQNMDTEVFYSIPSGWYNILYNLCEELTPILNEERSKITEDPEQPLFYVHQIKEKFGGLRFYFMMNTENTELHENIQKIIDIAEDKSYDTCQITGKPGTLCKKGRHFMTLSEEARITQGFEVVNGSTKSN
jgi:predicted alternative tryptophan synthase beta-subunit